VPGDRGVQAGLALVEREAVLAEDEIFFVVASTNLSGVSKQQYSDQSPVHRRAHQIQAPKDTSSAQAHRRKAARLGRDGAKQQRRNHLGADNTIGPPLLGSREIVLPGISGPQVHPPADWKRRAH
jgi:hypothetical protein